MGEIINDQDQQTIETGAAGAPEGAVAADPSHDEIAELYKATGVKAPVPTGKPKGRPKTTAVRAKDDASKGTGDSDAGDEEKADGKNKSKDAPNSNENDASGDKANPKSKEVSKADGEVQEDADETAGGVHDAKPKGEKDAERGSEEDAERGDDATGEADGEPSDKAKEDEGKRPGKSNPAVEQRMQQLVAEKRERDEVIERLQKQLNEKEQAVEQAKIAQEDPEYTIDDFRKVRDEYGEILELDDNQAELAWRRWKDGYTARAEERQAKANHEAAEAEKQSEMTRKVMEESVKAYDTLAGLMDEYPELVSDSGKFDKDFAAKAMPIIKESIEYAEGTEPGNPDDNQPVILGLRINPKLILAALKEVGETKRNLPLNGTNDNVEARSNVNVPHSRSSDPTVNAANELMKELKIDKRF